MKPVAASHGEGPGVGEVEWGVGLVWMAPRAAGNTSKKDGPDGKAAAIRSVIGHGAASAAILRVDLDNDVVISQTRDRAGKVYGKYRTEFFKAIEDGLVEEQGDKDQ